LKPKDKISLVPDVDMNLEGSRKKGKRKLSEYQKSEEIVDPLSTTSNYKSFTLLNISIGNKKVREQSFESNINSHLFILPLLAHLKNDKDDDRSNEVQETFFEESKNEMKSDSEDNKTNNKDSSNSDSSSI